MELLGQKLKLKIKRDQQKKKKNPLSAGFELVDNRSLSWDISQKSTDNRPQSLKR